LYTLRQKELEIEKLSMAFSDTSNKLQDIYVVLHVQISDVNMSPVIATARPPFFDSLVAPLLVGCL
jgi:hypothetical protein